MRAPGWLFLILSMIATSGCLDSVLGIMLAPEAVLGDFASNVTRNSTDLLNQAGEDLSSAAQTVTELDHLIADNPDAQNVERLKALREQLIATPLSDTKTPQTQAGPKLPQARQAMNDPLIPRRGIDQLTVLPPGEIPKPSRRAPPRPDTIGVVSDFREPTTKSYTLDMKPIRLR
jgi:hypothetical protein